MNYTKFLNDPVINSISVGLMVYCVIILSNTGNPILGSILSTLPIGLIGLISINNSVIRKKFISNTAFINIIIVLMWIFIYKLSEKEFKNVYILYAFIMWAVLCSGYFFVSEKSHNL